MIKTGYWRGNKRLIMVEGNGTLPIGSRFNYADRDYRVDSIESKGYHTFDGEEAVLIMIKLEDWWANGSPES